MRTYFLVPCLLLGAALGPATEDRAVRQVAGSAAGVVSVLVTAALYLAALAANMIALSRLTNKDVFWWLFGANALAIFLSAVGSGLEMAGPSTAIYSHIPWLLSYIPGLAVVYLVFRTINFELDVRSALLGVCIFLGLESAVGLLFVWGMAGAHPSFEEVAILIYCFLDLVLVACFWAIARFHAGGLFRNVWLLVSLYATFMFSAEVLYLLDRFGLAWGGLVGEFPFSGAADILWVLAEGILAFLPIYFLSLGRVKPSAS